MPVLLTKSCKLCKRHCTSNRRAIFEICKHYYGIRTGRGTLGTLKRELINERELCLIVDLADGYKPKEVENDILLQRIQENQLKCSRGKFRMVLPPPNVTGNLHLGHALMATVQDVICRQRTQMGYEVEWIPGVDHAGIATQVVVEKKVYQELGKTRNELGKEEFLKQVWKWKDSKGSNIMEDLKKLGCNLDWNKEYFTMDEKRSHAVKTAFIRLFDEGLIERRNSVVNWSCSLESAISDIEVETAELKGGTEIYVPGYSQKVRFGLLYDISYKVCNTEEEIVVSTTRPETMLGDVAVAVHPLDERYIKYRNMSEVKLWHPFRKEEIPLIFDFNVDKKFGTGAVKITPAHDKHDFEIAERHLLKPLCVFDKNGSISEQYGDFKGLPRFYAREKILEALSQMKQLKEIKDHPVNLPICARSKDVVEYLLYPQWFLKCGKLAEDALSEVKSGRLKIIPVNYVDDWTRWLTNTRDWCISRQLWWGHQIPAYHAINNDGVECWIAAYNENEAFQKAKDKIGPKIDKLERDNDVLDTWFSSALLPFAVNGWPSAEYKQNYPLDLIETGHDILFFWVARMVMLGLKLTNEVPFKQILLNGIVCDAHGRKMSKSLGNVITPQQVVNGASSEDLENEIRKSHASGILDLREMNKSIDGVKRLFPKGIPECGTDALRFTLCSHNIKSHFINFDISECYTNKLFMNKIWQATRFTLKSAEKLNMPLNEVEDMNNVPLSTWDLWILSKLHSTLDKCLSSLSNYNFHTATSAFKQFLHYNLCDIYLETTKENINNKNSRAYVHVATLATCLSWSLQAMSPFTPFLSGHLTQFLPPNIQISLNKFSNPKLEREIDGILEICQSVRQFKSRSNVTKKHNPHLILYAKKIKLYDVLKPHLDVIKALTRCTNVELETPFVQPSKKTNLNATPNPMCHFVLKSDVELLSVPELVAHTKETNEKKLLKLEKELERYRKRCESEGFRQAASEHIQKKHFAKIQQLEHQIKTIKALLTFSNN